MKNSNHRIKFILWSKRLWSESKLSLIFIVALLIFGIGFLILNLICDNKYSGNIVYSSLEWIGLIAGFITLVFSIRGWIETQEIQDKIEVRNKRAVEFPNSNNTVLIISVAASKSSPPSDITKTVNEYISKNEQLQKSIGDLDSFSKSKSNEKEIPSKYGKFKTEVSVNEKDNCSLRINLHAPMMPTKAAEDARNYYSLYCQLIDEIFELVNSENKKNIHVFFKGPGVLLAHVGLCSKNNATLFLYQNSGNSYIPLYEIEETASAS